MVADFFCAEAGGAGGVGGVASDDGDDEKCVGGGARNEWRAIERGETCFRVAR